MKKKYVYKVTLEQISTPNNLTADPKSIEFEFVNHDDVLNIIDKLNNKANIDSEMAAPLGLGIKLFGGVMLNNKKNPLFAKIWPYFTDFIKQLK